MTLSATHRSTISKLLGLISSHHDAEALAAARKANQILEAHGVTWPELLGLDVAPPAPEPDHVAMARELLRRGKKIVTRWEHDFLLGVMAFKSLKPKQVEILDAISLKIDAATA